MHSLYALHLASEKRPKNYYNAKYFYPFHLQENLETANKICQRFQDTENPHYRGGARDMQKNQTLLDQSPTCFYAILFFPVHFHKNLYSCRTVAKDFLHL